MSWKSGITLFNKVIKVLLEQRVNSEQIIEVIKAFKDEDFDSFWDCDYINQLLEEEDIAIELFGRKEYYIEYLQERVNIYLGKIEKMKEFDF